MLPHPCVLQLAGRRFSLRMPVTRLDSWPNGTIVVELGANGGTVSTTTFPL